MSKILFVGDPHLKITKFELAKNFLTWLNSTIASTKPDLIVNLGDTFDTHAVLRSEVMSEFILHVEHTLSLGIEYVYLLGNHDMYKPNDSKYHALKPLKNKIKGFHVIDEITSLNGITYVPYQHDISKFPTQTHSICVAHQTFKGADYGDVTTSDGVDPVSVSADVIISGHIHKKQVLGKVIYPGTPFSQNANDINQVKGLLLFDTDSFEQMFIPCPLPMWKGLKCELSPSFTIETMHQLLIQNLNNTDHWLVEITGPRAEIVGYLSSDDAKTLFDGKDVKVNTTFTDKEKKQIAIKAISMEQIVSEFIAKVYSGTLDKEDLQVKALEILASARQPKK